MEQNKSYIDLEQMRVEVSSKLENFLRLLGSSDPDKNLSRWLLSILDKNKNGIHTKETPGNIEGLSTRETIELIDEDMFNRNLFDFLNFYNSENLADQKNILTRLMMKLTNDNLSR